MIDRVRAISQSMVSNITILRIPTGIIFVDEGGHGAGIFLSEFGLDVLPRLFTETKISADTSPILYRLSDASGALVFEPVDPPAFTSLSSSDAFLFDHSSNATLPAIYVWIGQSVSLTERRLAVQYAQTYVYKKQAEKAEHITASISLVKMNEGYESEAFLQAFGA